MDDYICNECLCEQCACCPALALQLVICRCLTQTAVVKHPLGFLNGHACTHWKVLELCLSTIESESVLAICWLQKSSFKLFLWPYRPFFWFWPICHRCTKRTKPHHCRFFVNLGSSRHQNMVRKCADRAGLFSNVHETQSRTIFRGEMFVNLKISTIIGVFTCFYLRPNTTNS